LDEEGNVKLTELTYLLFVSVLDLGSAIFNHVGPYARLEVPFDHPIHLSAQFLAFLEKLNKYTEV